jgi:hypothetical protein
MAFFEFLASIGQTLNSALNLFIKPVGGTGTGGYVPAPTVNPPVQTVQGAGTVMQDADGSLTVRGATFSDEGSFADDFVGASIVTALSGTSVTLTNGSTTVTGVGTSFLTQLDTSKYIKLNADANSAWARVAQVLSNTSAILKANYTGTGGTGAASSSNWIQTVGTGGSIAVGSGSVTVVSGTTNGSITNIAREVDFIPLRAHTRVTLSQRIANQSFFVGFRDTVASSTVNVGVIFDGTVNTTVKFHSQLSSAAADIQEVTVTLPFALTTATELSYDIDVTPNRATLSIEGMMLAEFTQHIPGPYTNLFFVVEDQNTGVPASTTTLTMNLAQLTNYDQGQVTNVTAGECLPVQIREEIHYVTGALTSTATTADQVICSFTVPANKNAFIAGYSLSTDGNTDGLPVKIGRNTVTGLPATPGTIDATIFRAFRIDRASAGNGNAHTEDYSAMPRPIGHAGDVVKMTVTPGGSGSTVWIGTIDYILRPN